MKSYHSLKNLLLYRTERFVPFKKLKQKMDAAKTLAEIKLAITDYMLEALGLTVVNEPRDLTGIYLTPRQHHVIAMVTGAGYFVDLR